MMQSPTPTISDEDPLSASSSSAQLKEQLDQLEFDKDEREAQYCELKEKYDQLHAKYQDKKVALNWKCIAVVNVSSNFGT